MSSPARPPSDPPVALPPAGRAALRAGVVGNRIDNVHVFLPLTALAPVIARLAGPAAATGTGAVIVIAMLLGRPVGGLVLGPVSDRLGRTRTTRPTIGGTASCALLIGCMPTHTGCSGPAPSCSSWFCAFSAASSWPGSTRRRSRWPWSGRPRVAAVS